TLADAFRVVDAVDSDSQELRRDAQVRQEFFLRRGCGGGAVGIGEWDADGEGLHQSQGAGGPDGKGLPVDAAPEGLGDGLKKIIAMVLDVKTDDIGAEHALEQLPLPWANSEGLGIGPRYVPKNRDAGVRAAHLDELREEREVVILDENEGLSDVFYLF